MTPRFKGLALALAGTSAWATTGIFIAYLLDHYPLQPLTLAFWRDLMVAVTLITGLAVAQPRHLRLTRRDVLFFVGYGSLALALFNGLWTFSVKFNGAAVATVLAYSSPAFTVLLARAILSESLTPRKLLAVGLSLSGCVLVAKAYSASAWQVNPLGIAVGLGTGLAFAVYNLGGRWSSRRFASPWMVTAYGFLFAALTLGLTQKAGTLFSLGTRWDGWLILAALAVGPTLLGFGLFTWSLRYLQASAASLIATLEPALTAVMAIFLLGERLAFWQWVGAAVILAAAVLAQSDNMVVEMSA